MKVILKLLYLISIILNLTLRTSAINECAKKVHQGCLDDYVPTEEEVEKARIYIQKMIMDKAITKPKTAPCPKLYVRRNFKCMTEEERFRLTNSFKKLYENGFMWELADIHANCWIPWHRSFEGVAGHKIISTKVEQALRQVDPEVTLPYWKISDDCVNPHESIIWKYFGTKGTNVTNYCVTDGPFTEETWNRCIKRQWNPDGTITPWFCTDIEDVGLSPFIYMVFFLVNILGLHFHAHLQIGGMNGHYSQNWAPYDAIFHIHHNYYLDIIYAKFQVEYPEFILNIGGPYKYEQGSHTKIAANFQTDRVCYYNESVLDTLYIGFGQQCSVSDYLIKLINQKINKTARFKFTKIQSPMDRFKNKLRSMLWPEVSTDKLSINSLTRSPDPSECNPKCKPMPIPPDYTSDDNHRRQLKAYEEDWPGLEFPHLFLVGLTKLLNRIPGYCSPFVTSIYDISKRESVSDNTFQLNAYQLSMISTLRQLFKYFNNLLESLNRVT